SGGWMQRRQRRISSRQRNPRAARNPAYQIKPRYHLAPEKPAERHTENWETEQVQAADDSQWKRPGTVESPEPGPVDTTGEHEAAGEPEPSTDPEETAFHPETQPAEDDAAGHTAEVATVDD